MTNSIKTNIFGASKSALKISTLVALGGVTWWFLPDPDDEESRMRGVDGPDGPPNQSSKAQVSQPVERNVQGEGPLSPHMQEKSRTSEGLIASIRETLDHESLDRMALIITSSPENFQKRNNAVRNLGDRLDPEEVDALYLFLLSSPPEAQSERVHDRVIKNNVLNRLRNQEEAPEGLTQLMVTLFNEVSQDDAVRAYAIQHLWAWYSRSAVEERPVILEALSGALREGRGGIGGTALLALDDLEKTKNLPDSMQIRNLAEEMVQDDNGEELSQITAMQIAAERDSEEVLEIVRRWALDPASSYPRRASAIAALGASGSNEAVSILNQVAELEDQYLESALSAAVHKLKKDSGPEENNISQ